jgi:hypothetical protein
MFANTKSDDNLDPEVVSIRNIETDKDGKWSYAETIAVVKLLVSNAERQRVFINLNYPVIGNRRHLVSLAENIDGNDIMSYKDNSEISRTIREFIRDNNIK